MEWLICLTHDERVRPGEEPSFCAEGDALFESACCEIVPRLLVDRGGPSITLHDEVYPRARLDPALRGLPAGRYIRTDETGDK